MIQPNWITLCQGKQPFEIIQTSSMDSLFYKEIIEMKHKNPDLKVILIQEWFQLNRYEIHLFNHVHHLYQYMALLVLIFIGYIPS